MSVISRRLSVFFQNGPCSLSILKLKNNLEQKTAAVISPQIYKTSTPLSTTFLHQRLYCQSNKQTECWNCKEETRKVNHFICEKCGKLQDITKEYDYFELLSLSRSFDIPSTKLTKIFRHLQTLVHPDKFGNKSEREQANSADWSALINKAYKTLSQPLIRGQYLLKLKGEQMPHDNSTLNQTFLMEMMERNEEVDDADSAAELNQMNDKIQQEIKAEIGQLEGLFTSNDLNGAKAKLVKMKYLLSIQSSIQAKLEKLMNQ